MQKDNLLSFLRKFLSIDELHKFNESDYLKVLQQI